MKTILKGSISFDRDSILARYVALKAVQLNNYGNTRHTAP
jgi:hypothetical protein